MLRWSSPSTLWSTYVIASGTATRSTPSSSNCIPAIVPVASSSRTWPTSSTMSAPASSRPSRRCDSSSLWVSVRATGAGWYDRGRGRRPVPAGAAARAPGRAQPPRRAAPRRAGPRGSAPGRARAGRHTGGRIGEDADLTALARALREIGAPVERAHRLRFEPPYPGATAGVEELRDARRLVLACAALDAAGAPATVVFTTLITGRAPQVSAAPPDAAIPPGWTT